MATLADLLEQLGGIPLNRVRLQPPPGTATEQDVITAGKPLCELVDGVLVEKAVGYRESVLAMFLGQILGAFVRQGNQGLVSGPDGMVRLLPGLVREPDVAFISWERLPDRRVPSAPVPAIIPDLAVEVLSASNTAAEMARKRREYFAAGVRLVWIVDPATRTVAVHTAPEQAAVLDANATLTGGDVLPGFALPLRDLFAELDRQGD
jgi:Uma2 family endonuclease